MIITCEKCTTRFRLEDERIPESGTQVRCSRCGTAFFVVRSESTPNSGEEDQLTKSFRDFNHEAGIDAATGRSAVEAVVEERSQPQQVDTGLGDLERSELYAAEMDMQTRENEKPDEMDWEFEGPIHSESSASIEAPLAENPGPSRDACPSLRMKGESEPPAEEEEPEEGVSLELDMGDVDSIGEDNLVQMGGELETDPEGDMEIEGQEQPELELQRSPKAESTVQENDFGLYRDPVDEEDCGDEEGFEEDHSMEGLIEAVADEVGTEDLEQIGTPENWNLLSDSRSELVGASPSRVEDLSTGIGPEDLVQPTGSGVAVPVTADFSAHTEAVAADGLAEKVKVPEPTDQHFEPLRAASSPDLQKGALAMGWAATLAIFVWAAFTSFVPSSVPSTPATRGVDLAGYRVSKLEAQLVENRSGSDLLVVSGELRGTAAFVEGRTLSVALFGEAAGDEIMNWAAIGTAWAESDLRERNPVELRELTDSLAGAWSHAVTLAGEPIPFQAIFADPSPQVTRFELRALPEDPAGAGAVR